MANLTTGFNDPFELAETLNPKVKPSVKATDVSFNATDLDVQAKFEREGLAYKTYFKASEGGWYYVTWYGSHVYRFYPHKVNRLGKNIPTWEKINRKGRQVYRSEGLASLLADILDRGDEGDVSTHPFATLLIREFKHEI